MLRERLLSKVMASCTDRYLKLDPTDETKIPGPVPGKPYMLYMHVPFCERLCPYCSFNRFPFDEARALAYFDSMRRELMMVKELGYDFESLYIGGGTPTIMMDQLCETIDMVKREFSVKEVSCETNPNHLTPEHLRQMEGRIDRLSVGVQSFDDGLLKQMDRYEKYGSGDQIKSAIKTAAPYFKSLNVDMIFNFPAQTEEILRADLEAVLETGTSQTTFYPLMASPAVEKSLARTVGQVDYNRERRFYEIISETLTGIRPDGSMASGSAPFTHGSAWTFNAKTDMMIDEYIVDYDEYPALGSGGITFLGNNLYVNTFSVAEYNSKIASGSMSIMGKAAFSKHDRMRYKFMMQLFSLRLDKKAWLKEFGVSVESGLRLEYTYMKLAGAFAIDDEEQLTLTPMGRYLMVVMMRQFFIGVNNLRDQARAALPEDERALLFGAGCAME